MSVSRHRAHRIEHRRSEIRQGADENIGNRPEAGFKPVQNRRQQDCCTYDNGERTCRMAVFHRIAVDQDRLLAHVPKAQHMNDDGRHDQGAAPYPVGAPGPVTFKEKVKSELRGPHSSLSPDLLTEPSHAAASRIARKAAIFVPHLYEEYPCDAPGRTPKTT